MRNCIDIFSVRPVRGGKARGGPVSSVQPLSGGVLRLELTTGSTLEVCLRSEFDKLRFLPLRNPDIWHHVDTDGSVIRWYRDGVKVVEMTWGELLTVAVGSRWM